MSAAFREVRDPVTHDLLFEFDPVMDLVRIVRRRVTTIIDLAEQRQLAEQEALDFRHEGITIGGRY